MRDHAKSPKDANNREWDLEGRKIHGPWLQRLIRRTHGLSWGSEEPGLSSDSELEREERRFSAKLTKLEPAHARLGHPDPKKRPTQAELKRIAEASRKIGMADFIGGPKEEDAEEKKDTKKKSRSSGKK